jgi:hypothetical protein
MNPERHCNACYDNIPGVLVVPNTLEDFPRMQRLMSKTRAYNKHAQLICTSLCLLRDARTSLFHCISARMRQLQVDYTEVEVASRCLVQQHAYLHTIAAQDRLPVSDLENKVTVSYSSPELSKHAAKLDLLKSKMTEFFIQNREEALRSLKNRVEELERSVVAKTSNEFYPQLVACGGQPRDWLEVMAELMMKQENILQVFGAYKGDETTYRADLENFLTYSVNMTTLIRDAVLVYEQLFVNMVAVEGSVAPLLKDMHAEELRIKTLRADLDSNKVDFERWTE